MGNLKGQVIKRSSLSDQDIETMFGLMNTFYDNMNKEVFLRDLSRKDFCIVLRDVYGVIQGFSTQQVLHVPMGKEMVHGVFSGDTIIHKQSWGSLELFRQFARFFFDYGKEYGTFYWFLISKGYKTYKILPTFCREFYPNYRTETPQNMKSVMDAFGRYLYSEEYDPKSGVICYKGIKDKLKNGVADVTESLLRDNDVAFFVKKNPDYQKGNDLVCIARLSTDNLLDRTEKILF